MKRILAFSFAVLLIAPYCLKLGVWVWYFQNKDYIASELCENKDKPELECEGQCVLNKALKKADCCAEQNDARGTIPPLKKTLESLAFDYLPICTTINTSLADEANTITHNFYYSFGVPRLSASGIFHPPC